ncbi:DNA topoisomerase IV subunit B family protein [Myxococcus qinghaiensis]|uniref:hypothetical protein n=1 Tax=Myxococcus qinghaiensis TaxID=2906758 RepID=UPI0020A78C4B|nr:hypothetical protein [Myxococcus qinghaiensis]
MTSMHINKLWGHEAIRARPGMYVGGEDRPAQAASLLKLTVEAVASTRDGPERIPVELRIWPGPVFELSCPWEDAPFQLVSHRGASLSVIDLHMTTLFVGAAPLWGLLGSQGIILNALSSRVLLQTSNGETRREAMYSRGGIISPMMDLLNSSLHGSRVVFELDPLFFDADARAHAHSDAVIEDLRTRFPWLTVSQRAADASAGDPW